MSPDLRLALTVQRREGRGCRGVVVFVSPKQQAVCGGSVVQFNKYQEGEHSINENGTYT